MHFLTFIRQRHSIYFATNWSFVSNIKQLRQPITSNVTYDVGALTVCPRIYWCKFLKLSSKTSCYIRKCIRMFFIALHKHFGCYDNLRFHWLTMGKVKIKIYCYLIEDILTKVLQKCLLNGPPPTYQAYHWSPNLSIWLVAMETGRLNLQKKNVKKSTTQKLQVGLSWHITELFIILTSIKRLFFIAVA